MNKTFARIGGIVMLATLLLTMVTCFKAMSFGTTQGPQNSLGTVAYTENPFIYNVGAMTDAEFVGDDESLLLTFSPMGTYQFYTEKIQFCGNPMSKFDGKKNPIVLTYTREAYRNIEGRGCHELVRVDGVKQ